MSYLAVDTVKHVTEDAKTIVDVMRHTFNGAGIPVLSQTTRDNGVIFLQVPDPQTLQPVDLSFQSITYKALEFVDEEVDVVSLCLHTEKKLSASFIGTENHKSHPDIIDSSQAFITDVLSAYNTSSAFRKYQARQATTVGVVEKITQCDLITTSSKRKLNTGGNR